MRAPILAGALLVSSAAWSQEGPYVGLGVGIFDYEEDITGPFSFSDTAAIYKLYGGYRFNKRWAVEGYLTTAARLKDELYIATPATADLKIAEVRGLAFFGNLFLGIGYWDSRFSTSTMLSGPSNSDFSLVLGGEWPKNKWNFRLEAEVFNTDEAAWPFGSDHSINATSLSFGAQYRFGRH